MNVYELVIAETFLRRTNATAAEKVYVEFLRRFPGPEALGGASNEDIEEIIKPLGLAWRAENLKDLAQHFRHSPKIPNSISALQKMPGIGPYIARAVLVNSLQLKAVPVDSNIVRVLSRCAGIIPSDNLRRNKNFQILADSFLESPHFKETNYALLDLAALVCRPSNPKCSQCPLVTMCNFGKRSKKSI
jgi:A/G-specific adenine glycosylase